MRKLKELFIIGTCLLMWAVLLSGWTTLNTSTPAGGDDPREADDRTRELKAAFVERLDIDHYFEASATSTYDHADTGKHRYVTFREPNSIVSVAADEAYLYTKDANSIAELHWIDENEAEFQLTSDGYLYGNSLKSGSVLTAAIADANVTLAKMADDSIDSNSYVDGSIDTAHIADANITSTLIADDTILPADVNSIFGTWTDKDSTPATLVKDGVYKAGSDGFILASVTGQNNTLVCYTDGSNPPTTIRVRAYGYGSDRYANITMPVKKDDYVKITSGETPTIYWLPIGSGSLVKQ